MRLFARTRGTSSRFAGATALALLLAVGAHAGTAQSAPATKADLKAWHEKIAKVEHPSAQGCFTSAYPKLKWQEVQCKAPRTVPMVPKPGGPRPLVIGNGNDISAEAPGATFISETWGTFENIMNVTSISSPIGNMGAPVNDAYTLQININPFASPACAASPNPGCRGWEQFVFANDGSTGEVFIQYWLLQYNDTCPGGWFQFQFDFDPDIYCYRNSPGITGTPNQPIGNLGNLTLYGTATGGGDSVTLFDDAAMAAYSQAGGNYVTAAAGWEISEFNIFGYGGNSAGGGMASFNAGASVNVRTRINYGGTMPPICRAEGFTGETNNLSFAPPMPPAAGLGPAVIFVENTTGGSATNCANARVIGDTHQTTFAGLAYDFQATGDFVEAQAPAFEVQTRKISGAPTWPNTSVNKSVATRMGLTKVALCDPQRIFVDGRIADLPSKGAVELPSGITIHHNGNTYVVIDPSGNSITVTFNSGYTDVKVGLGTWPTTARGLLGNPGNDPNKLEARDGTVFTVPLSFDDLYNRFGNSWRVTPIRTLLSPCDPVAAGNPAVPFYAQDLDPELRQRAEGICDQFKVPEAWLGNCVLDVAVIGERAALVYVGMEPPVVDGNPRK
jgi:hypothetical protein